jgi:DNA-binding transcriptional ArsR family regulator
VKITDFFRIISDPTRIRVLLLLQNGESYVSEMAENFAMTKSAVSHQLNLMRSQQVVTARRDGKQIYYRLADGPMRDLINNAAFQTTVMSVAAQ